MASKTMAGTNSWPQMGMRSYSTAGFIPSHN
jgi:hypothetical protein